MKKLFTHHDPLLTGYLHATLEAAGIEAVLKNSYLSGAIGELPPMAVWPEIWIVNDDDLPRARQVMQDVLPDENSIPPQ